MILQNLILILRASCDTRYFIFPINTVFVLCSRTSPKPILSQVRLFPVFPPSHWRGKGADLLSWGVSPSPRGTGADWEVTGEGEQSSLKCL